MINEKINHHKDFYFGDLQKNLKKRDILRRKYL